MEVASVGYEANPFKWSCDGRLSHTEVTFAWSWLDRGERRHELVCAQLHHLTSGERLVPRPTALRDNDEGNKDKLERKAREVYLCKYLGQWQGSRYEPDPANWLLRCNATPGGGKSKTRVWHE